MTNCSLCPPDRCVLAAEGVRSPHPPYLACAPTRSREGKDTEPSSLCQIAGFGLNEGKSRTEATVSKWQHSEAKGLMGSSDGVPAANQRTPPRITRRDNRSGGKSLPLNLSRGSKSRYGGDFSSFEARRYLQDLLAVSVCSSCWAHWEEPPPRPAPTDTERRRAVKPGCVY